MLQEAVATSDADIQTSYYSYPTIELVFYWPAGWGRLIGRLRDKAGDTRWQRYRLTEKGVCGSCMASEYGHLFAGRGFGCALTPYDGCNLIDSTNAGNGSVLIEIIGGCGDVGVWTCCR